MRSKSHAKAREEAVRHPALVDPLTGLASRLHFDLVYDYFFDAGDRGMTFTVMLLSCGADATSDTRIKSIGEVLGQTTRTSDLVSHIDGLYVLVLVGTSLPGSRIVADRLETALDQAALGAASFGLASYATHPTSSAALLDAAEHALLEAESAGGGVQFA